MFKTFHLIKCKLPLSFVLRPLTTQFQAKVPQILDDVDVHGDTKVGGKQKCTDGRAFLLHKDIEIQIWMGRTSSTAQKDDGRMAREQGGPSSNDA